MYDHDPVVSSPASPDAVACTEVCPVGSVCDLAVGECVVDVAAAFSIINFRHYLLDGVVVFTDLETTEVRKMWGRSRCLCVCISWCSITPRIAVYIKA